MADFLWKELSEEEREQIRADAKKLILEFGDRIEQLPDREESFVEREGDRREEISERFCSSSESRPSTRNSSQNSPCKVDKKFREIMFENAPKKKGDFILGERGRWVE